MGYYYLGISDVLQDALRLVAPVRNEQGSNFYYHAAITDWFTLAADVQAIDPAQFDARSSLIFGVRASIAF